MATHCIAAHAPRTNLTAFRNALASFEQADHAVEAQPTDANRVVYRRSLHRLLQIPSPDVAGLATKLAIADPFDLDEYYAIVADARRLAGL